MLEPVLGSLLPGTSNIQKLPPRTSFGSENDAPPSFLGWLMVCLLVWAGLASSVQHAAGCGLALSPVFGLQCGLGRDGGCV
ncbi:hypothetical protein V6N12_045949 [Hibiscus sabdariffa]|uniref:Uncharacterized protein n=1 Tax=Hibiscus sabdariffa TaxID=183260 RepID=A0ABR2G4C3_9ROSI